MSARPTPAKIAREASDLAFQIAQVIERRLIDRAAANALAEGPKVGVVVGRDHVWAALDQIHLSDVHQELELPPNGSECTARISA